MKAFSTLEREDEGGFEGASKALKGRYENSKVDGKNAPFDEGRSREALQTPLKGLEGSPLKKGGLKGAFKPPFAEG